MTFIFQWKSFTAAFLADLSGKIVITSKTKLSIFLKLGSPGIKGPLLRLMSPAWRQQCSAKQRVCPNEYEWELFSRIQSFLNKSFYVSFSRRRLINYSSALVQKHNCTKQALGTHAAKKQAEAAAGGNQCAQIFDFDFESVSYLRITFPRKYQIVSGPNEFKIGPLISP